MATLAAAAKAATAAKRNSAAAVCGKRLKLETSKTQLARNSAWVLPQKDIIRFEVE